MRRAIAKAEMADTIAHLVACEGEGTAQYWRGFDLCLKHGWRLSAPVRHPPPDAVNLTISFFSGMLRRDIATLARRRGLHPGLAALHESRDAEAALTFDLIEPFRAPLAEGLALVLFNNGALRQEMFARSPESGAVTLWGPARPVLIRQYEYWTGRPVKSQRGGGIIPWKEILEEEVEAYAESLESGQSFRPYLMKA